MDIARFLSVAAVSLPAFASAPAFIPLGNLPGAQQGCFPSGISRDGRVVVGVGYDPAEKQIPVRWTDNHWSSAQPLAGYPSGRTTFEVDASGDGSVAIGSFFGGGVGLESFRWQNTPVTIPPPPGPFENNKATAVSADGLIVVGYAHSWELGAHAWRWTPQSGAISINGASLASEIHTLSADGAYGGGAIQTEATAGRRVPALWQASTGWTVIDSPVLGGRAGTVLDVSDDGRVAVGVVQVSPIEVEGFRWVQGAGVSLLPPPPPPAPQTDMIPLALSADGAVVVGRAYNVAFIWTASTGTRSLKEFAEDELGLALGGWFLGSADDISADGRRVTGNASTPTFAFQGYLLDLGGTFVIGDMNCDGVISVGDIAGFVLALTNPAAYAAQFPNCDITLADINNNGAVNVGDIGPFVLLLTGG